MSDFEYGIRHRKAGHIHSDGMTEAEARQWMADEDWDDIDPWKIFEIVRHPVVPWEWEVVPPYELE